MTRNSKVRIPAEKTAIVLIEPQNDFLTPGGTMYQYIADQLKERGVIRIWWSSLDGARGKAKIFYCPFQAFKPGFPELKPGGPGTAGLRGIEMEMKADWGAGAWLDGTPGPEIIDPLTPKEGDVIVRGKLTLDAFHSTALNYLLGPTRSSTWRSRASTPTGAWSPRPVRPMTTATG